MSEKKRQRHQVIADQKGVENVEVPDTLPVLPARNTVLYPYMVMPLLVAREKSVTLIEQVLAGNRLFAMVAQKDPKEEEPKAPDLHEHGTVGMILKMLKFPDDSIRVLVQGVKRVRLAEYLSEDPFFEAKIDVLEDQQEPGAKLDDHVSQLRSVFNKLIEQSPVLPSETQVAAMNIDKPGLLADFVATNLNLGLEDQQALLKALDVDERVERVIELVNGELEVIELGSKIQDEVKSQMDKNQREYYLRQQLKAIRKELGEDEGSEQEVEDFRERIEEAEMPEDARKAADRELDRLSRMHPDSAEYTVTRTYLDWLCSLPWNQESDDKLDLDESQTVLDEDHYGLEKVKERILEYLAVRKLKHDMKGPILCFIGPPGVGKTSLGRSIARAMDRKFERIALGGIRDEAEIRGHRRTYIGSLPGRIIRSLRHAETNNPVFMLDEIDKVGTDFRGDPSSALLEVLDPEQNNSFTDHYLDVPFDLSTVLFIATGNIMDTIPPPLRDRMEVIELPGYTMYEKVQIAKRHLIPKQIEGHGLEEKHLSFTDEALQEIISSYTREAGVRNLERNIAGVCRKVARKVAGGEDELQAVDADNVEKFLGPEKFFTELTERTDTPGIAIGLAWTQSGGDILFIESTRMQGNKRFRVTGKLGDVMSESAEAAFSYIRSKADDLGIDPEFFEKSDIHVHVPAGAIPKDGPSAGITMATSLASLLTGRLVRSDTAMTGEITLRGKVLPIGGLKEKVLAAHRAGIKRLIIPNHNEKDIDEVPEEVREELEFIVVDDVWQVLEHALEASPPGDPGEAEAKEEELPPPPPDSTPQPGKGIHA